MTRKPAALLILIPALLFAQPDVRHLAEESRRFPPEFAADALLRLAGLRRQPAEWRRAQIEDAFHIAGSADSRVKKTGRTAPGQPRMLDAFAADLELDTLSLQSRAVTGMLALDASRARELFQQIVLPQAAELPCGALAPDFSSYYAAASAILHGGFAAEERRRGEPFQFAIALIRGSTAAEQFGPLTRMLVDSGLDSGELRAAAGALAETLARFRAGDVSFSAAVWRDGLLNHVSALSSALESGGSPVQPLADSARQFFVTHLTAERCAINAEDPRPAMALRDVFNARFGHAVQPIRPEDLLPARMERAAARQQDGDEALSYQLRRLRVTDHNDPQWNNMLQQAVESVAAREPGDAGAADAFHEKAGLLLALAEITPPGDGREQVLRRYAGLVTASPVRQSHPAGWFVHAQILVSRLLTVGAASLVQEVRASGDGLLAYYSALDAIAPEPRAVCSDTGVCPPMAGADAMRAELLSVLFN